MSQKILFHKQATDSAVALGLAPDTFVVSEAPDGSLQ